MWIACALACSACTSPYLVTAPWHSLAGRVEKQKFDCLYDSIVKQDQQNPQVRVTQKSKYTKIYNSKNYNGTLSPRAQRLQCELIQEPGEKLKLALGG